MQNLEKRIALLERGRGSELERLTDAELDARLAALGAKDFEGEELTARIATLKAQLANVGGLHHAKH